ncbi:TIGR03885 family FMN-dependent LLM class oxidoreductase [Nakamurella deserti]|uniref:TIGR03885 family FMN-dependent LLM class oxidoreductase n=1 Tax=Nakamurella deserti TaxID=2164074 RepID=UPI000DBE4C67|nr:TIGR03885 family FMN-dependent LLM class oxidoreductase [Nakamurella deserti]
MVLIGFHASHEQVHPAVLRDSAVQAEQAGFDSVMCSDHLAPWTSKQGHSGFTWSWLGAALQATQRIPMGSFHAPGQRYHPVVSAHAMATLAAMFPGRLPWVALGSGEALNEHVTGDRWPSKPERMERLRECVDVMRALWRGEEVSHRGHVIVDRARLWSLPEVPPELVAGAVSAETAAWAAGWADGLITVNQPVDQLRRVVGAYRDAGGRGPLRLQVHLSWAPDAEEATAIAVDQWQGNCVPTDLAWNLEHPEQFEAATRHVPPAVVAENVLTSADLAQHTAWLAEFAALGFDELMLHHVGQHDDPFIAAFSGHVLPQLQQPAVA